MENEDSWDFDIFNLEAATMKRYGGEGGWAGLGWAGGSRPCLQYVPAHSIEVLDASVASLSLLP